MNTRRSFFQRIAGLVAAVAIAPEIAFRTKLALPEVEATVEETIAYYRYYQLNGVAQMLEECEKAFEVESIMASRGGEEYLKLLRAEELGLIKMRW